MALFSSLLPSAAEPTVNTSSTAYQQSEVLLWLGARNHVGKSKSCFNLGCRSTSTFSHVLSRKMPIAYQDQSSDLDGSTKKKIAKLCVQKRERVQLPTYKGVTGRQKPLKEFLRHPAGMESMLNTKSLQSHEYIGNNTFRCVLPKLEILSFEVAPVIDLSVIADDDGCVVELLSCKFQGSEAIENQNERFSASLRNHLSWDSSSQDNPMLDVDVQLNVSLEVYTLPFTLLPLSAVETPGTAILQALIDRMVPLFLEYLLDDYYKWSQLDDDGDKMGLRQAAESE